MRFRGEVIQKAINEGFEVLLRKDGKIVGKCMKNDGKYFVCVMNGSFSAVQELTETWLFQVEGLNIDKKNKVFSVRG